MSLKSDVSVGANLSALRSELGKIPGITEGEAKKMVIALERQYKKAENAAKASFKHTEKAISAAAKKAEADFKAIDEAGKKAFGGRGGILGDVSAVAKGLMAMGPAGAAAAIGIAAVVGAGVGIAKVVSLAAEYRKELEAAGRLSVIGGQQQKDIDAFGKSMTEASLIAKEAVVILGGALAGAFQLLATGVRNFAAGLREVASWMGEVSTEAERSAEKHRRLADAIGKVDEKMKGLISDELLSAQEKINRRFFERNDLIEEQIRALEKLQRQAAVGSDEASDAALRINRLRAEQANLEQIRANAQAENSKKEKAADQAEIDRRKAKAEAAEREAERKAAAARRELEDIARAAQELFEVETKLAGQRSEWAAQGEAHSREQARELEALAAVHAGLTAEVLTGEEEKLAKLEEELAHYTRLRDDIFATEAVRAQAAQIAIALEEKKQATLDDIADAAAEKRRAAMKELTAYMIDQAFQMAAGAEGLFSNLSAGWAAQADEARAHLDTLRDDFKAWADGAAEQRQALSERMKRASAEEREAALVELQERQSGERQARKDAIADEKAKLDKMQKQAHRAALVAFAINQTAAASAAIMASAQAFMTLLASPMIAALGPGAPLAAGAISGLALTASLAKIATTKPPQVKHRGGEILGRRTRAPDEVDVRAQTGEKMMTKAANQRHGPLLDKMNRGEGVGVGGFQVRIGMRQIEGELARLGQGDGLFGALLGDLTPGMGRAFN